MSPGSCPITVYRGDTWAMSVAVTDAAGNPIDLTGWQVRAQIRGGDTWLVDIDAVVVDDGQRISLSLSPEKTADLPGGGVWDLETVEPGGMVRTLLAGPVRLTEDVTR